MVTVCTQNELQNALKAKESRILIKGALAEKMKSKVKKQKTAKKVGQAAAGIGIAAIAAAPFTGGTSLAVSTASIMGLTAGGVTISIAELAILTGFGLGIIGLLKGYNVKFNSDGSIELNR